MNGWIKLHRKLLDWEWINSPEMVSLFIYLLLTANHEDKDWHGQTIKRGQTIVGREKLSRTLGISQQTIRTCLTRLKSTSEVAVKTTNKFSIITIINWEQYQCDDKKSTSKSTSQLSHDQPTTNQQLTTPKELKNIRSKEERISTIVDTATAEQVDNRNKDINWLIDEFQNIMSFKSSGNKDRFMAKHLLNNFSKEQLTAMLTYCSTNEYAPRIGSVEKLWYKRGDIIAGIKSLQSSKKIIQSL